MKHVFLTLGFLFSIHAQADVCDATKLAEIKKMISPDFIQGGELILPLLDRAMAGELACDLQSKEYPPPTGGRLTMCGAGDPKWLHTMTFALPNNNLRLVVREDYDCGVGFWVRDIISDRGGIVQTTTLGKKTLGLLRQKACSQASDYQVVKFKTADDDMRKSDITKMVNLAETPCENAEVVEAVVEL